jgi:hypothetical protein
MKTQVIFSAAFAMFFSLSALANTTNEQISLTDSFGRILYMPVMVEEEINETLPFDIKEIFHEEMVDLINNQVDITSMIIPEQEIEDETSYLLMALSNTKSK